VDASDREQILKSLDTIMAERHQARTTLLQTLKEFSSQLFDALEAALTTLTEAGIPGLGKYRRLAHPSGGIESFQMFIEDWSIIFVPLRGLARPNVHDEARIPSAQFKQPSARIAVFLSDNPQGNAFYDFLIFQDRSWFAWGYGWPKQQADLESTDFESLAYEIIYSFVKDIFTTWHPRDTTVLATALDTKKRCYTFGLPGEEPQGI